MLIRITFVALFVVLLIAATLVNAQSGRNVVRPTPTPTPTSTPPDDQELRIVTEEIKINVSAFDNRGQFFADVRADDLVIDEDNVLHQATSIRRTPANVLIMLDTGGEDRAAKDFKSTKAVAKSLIESLAPEDSIALMEVNDSVRILTEWTSDKDQLYAALSKDLKFGKRSRFVEALGLAVEFFGRSGTENRHLVLITDGLDSSSNESQRESAITKLLTTDINVHIFSYTKLELEVVKQRKSSMVRRGPSPRQQLPPGAEVPVKGQTTTYPTVTINTDREMMKKNKQRGEDLEKSEKALGQLAENTNGIFFLPATIDEMLSKAAFLARNIDAQYVVTYTPKRPLSVAAKGEARSISVTSRRNGLEILGRRKLIVLQ